MVAGSGSLSPSAPFSCVRRQGVWRMGSRAPLFMSRVPSCSCTLAERGQATAACSNSVVSSRHSGLRITVRACAFELRVKIRSRD